MQRHAVDFGMQFIRRVPFFRLCLFLALGALAQHSFCLEIPFSLLAIAALILIALFLYCASKSEVAGLSGVPIALCCLILGLMSSQLVSGFRVRELPDETLSRAASFTGEILETKKTEKGLSVKLMLRAASDSSDQIICLSTGVLAYLKDTSCEAMRPGNFLSFSASLQRIPEPELNYHFDAKSYYESKGFYYRAFISENKYLITKNQGFSFANWRSRVLETIRKSYDAYGFNARDKAYLMALALGEKAALPQALKEAYQNLGISHILAVSGLHVGIIWLSLSCVLYLVFLGRQSVLKYLLGLMFLWLYVFLTGAASSVIRAGIMISVYVFSLMLNRRGNSMNTIIAAAFLMLFWNPVFLFDVGFQLSFAAVLGIVSCMPFVSNFFQILPLIPKKVLELSSVSIVAQAATLPVSLYYFGNFPLFFLPANLLFLPSLAIELCTAIALILLQPFQNYLLPIVRVVQACLAFKNDVIMQFSERVGQGLVLSLDSELSVVMMYAVIVLLGLIFLGRQFHLLKFLLLLGIAYGIVDLGRHRKLDKEDLRIVRKGSDYWIELEREGVLYAIADTGLSKWDYHLKEAEKNFQKLSIYHPDTTIRTACFAIKHGYFATNDTLLCLAEREKNKLRLTYSVP